MFFNQPLAARFGTELTDAIQSGRWTELDIAVAWVRASGLRHLKAPLSSFLLTGGRLSVVVGVDLENTSSEGLAALVELEQFGAAKSFVYHNEAGTVFHPKLFLFRNNNGEARLIVGSNNLTESGLFRNTEAGLQLDLATADPVVNSVLNAFESWRDIESGLSRVLNDDLVKALSANGYVKSESVIRKAAAERQQQARSQGKKIAKLFKSVPVSAPVVASSKDTNNKTKGTSASKKAARATVEKLAAQSATSQGKVLIMRVRKASATGRPTQTQLPKALADSSFFSGVESFVSSHTGESHAMHPARARDIINTIKLEIPEIRHFDDPVVRFEHTKNGVRYEAYDSTSAQGRIIRDALEQGRAAGVKNPTKLTRPQDPARATWWRFI